MSPPPVAATRRPRRREEARGRRGAAAAAQLVGRGGGGFCQPGGRLRPSPPGQPRVSVSVEAGGGGGASVMAKPESPRAAVSTCRRHRRRRSAGVGGSGQARSRRRRRGGEGPAPGGWRAYARGEPGEGALPARAALPARGPPRACHGCGQLPPPLQPADPGVGTRLPRLLRRLEVRAGRGWVAPPPFPAPREVRASWSVRFPPEGRASLHPAASSPALQLSRLRDS